MTKSPFNLFNLTDNIVHHIYQNIPNVGGMIRFRLGTHELDLRIMAKGNYEATLHFKLTNPRVSNWYHAGELNKTDLANKVKYELEKLNK